MFAFILSLFTRYSVVEEYSYWSMSTDHDDGVLTGFDTPISRHLTKRGALRAIRNHDRRFFAENGFYFDDDGHHSRYVMKGVAKPHSFGRA